MHGLRPFSHKRRLLHSPLNTVLGGLQTLPSILLVVLCASCSTPTPSLIDSIVPPYPNDLTSMSGSCSGPSLEEICDFSVSVLHTSRGEPISVLAMKRVAHINDEARWRVTDQIPFPALAENQFLATYDCRSGANRIWGLTAVVTYSRSDGYSPAVKWAYLLNHTTGKFLKYSPQGIACLTAA